MSGTSAIVTWIAQLGFNYSVQARRWFIGSPDWDSTDVLGNGAPRDVYQQTYPQVAMSESAALITWSWYNRSRNIVQIVRSANGGENWNGPVPMNCSLSAFEPQVAVSGSNVLVT
jgi:hypothetical protein